MRLNKHYHRAFKQTLLACVYRAFKRAQNDVQTYDKYARTLKRKRECFKECTSLVVIDDTMITKDNDNYVMTET